MAALQQVEVTRAVRMGKRDYITPAELHVVGITVWAKNRKGG